MIYLINFTIINLFQDIFHFVYLNVIWTKPSKEKFILLHFFRTLVIYTQMSSITLYDIYAKVHFVTTTDDPASFLYTLLWWEKSAKLLFLRFFKQL